MAVWAVADLHLSFGVPNKKMDVFGAQWQNHTEKLERNWKNHIHNDDLVLLPGDISWAMRLEEVVPDFEWIHHLPGTKVMLRGNHDYWWTSLSRVEKILPSSIHLIQNNVFNWKNVSVGGARLWDSPEYQFSDCIDYQENPRAKVSLEESPAGIDPSETEKIFVRELGRLEMSVKSLSPNAQTKIVMTHYPPIGLDLKDSRASRIIEKSGATICVFGHLHNVRRNFSLFGETRGVRYALTACDYLDFMPLKLLDSP
jgi:hypothetical protein